MRLIDADALVQALHEAGTVMGQPHFLCRTVYECINNAPIVDAVPVVMCKDCKHRIKWNDSFGCAFWGYYGDEFADGEMFCSKGERKDDD